MIRFDKPVTLVVETCDQKAVREVVGKLRKNGSLPFFILDEMTLDSSGGENEAAFQRNVFRVCGLLVILMGNDSRITSMIQRSGASRGSPHLWVSVVSRFPSYQFMLFTTNEKHIWPRVVARFPVVEVIAQRSRGGFSRYFIDEVVQRFQRDPGVELCDLLDAAFPRVCKEMHRLKPFFNSSAGVASQLLAISYTYEMDDGDGSVAMVSTDTMGVAEPAQKKRRVQVEASGMHHHFANMVDEEITDVSAVSGDLMIPSQFRPGCFIEWKPKCAFASIDDDMLLYLAIVGGKTYPSYYDNITDTKYSTKHVFSLDYLEKLGRSESTPSLILDYTTIENMVIHAIFSSSRRNGARGIPFGDFLPCFLGEFEDKIWVKEVLLLAETETGAKEQQIHASELLDGYDAGTLAERTIPFLAPPNTQWPQPILNTNADGCNFGHLVCVVDEERCDMYVQGLEDNEKAVFICESAYLEQDVDIGEVRGILTGVETEWGEDWNVIIVFCSHLNICRTDWARENFGCVKLTRGERPGTVIVTWVFQPNLEEREKLMIVIETGMIAEA